MIQGSFKPAGALSQSGLHNEFLELCAASTSGELSDDEQKRLQEHLAACAACREALGQYESIVSDVIPAIAAGEEPEHVPLRLGPRNSKNKLKRRCSTAWRMKRSIHPEKPKKGTVHRSSPIASFHFQASPPGVMSGCSTLPEFFSSAP